ncbi:MAG TPA: YbaK/EbsC family protein [Chloroflexia bacterium]|nr:YbaK/EbsC family protein [Chloroflexia bacterium]
MNCKERLEKFLRENRVYYQLQHHPESFTAQGVANSMHISNRAMAKVVMALADEKLVMLVLPAFADVNLKEISHIIGVKKVQLAEEAEFGEVFPDCELGAMPPFGNLYHLPVYVDMSLTSNDIIYFQAGSHVDTISMRYSDYVNLVKPVVDSFVQEEALSYSG